MSSPQKRRRSETRERATSPSQHPLPAVVSLFSGAGGLDCGFAQAGFGISVAVDSSEAAMRSHHRNFPNARVLVRDLSARADASVCEAVDDVVDANSSIGVIGGPPCQGFSRANSRRRADDPRNELVYSYLSHIKRLGKLRRVDFVVFENVLGITDRGNRSTLLAIESELLKLGLRVTKVVLNAADFGVPQTRKRVFVIAVRASATVAVKAPSAARRLTVEDALRNMPEPVYFERGLQTSTIGYHPNHWTMVPRSKRFVDDSTDARSRSFRRLLWDSPSPTLAFGNREVYVHPNGHRRLSVLEALLLQGFPTTFVLEGNLSQQFTQVSNAVAPPVARAVADSVRAALLVPRGAR